ncbi:MAG: zf-HC2 domain-containing protein [Candidatus Riflebacteria bacterium]|nr:zf-HC2 domain-containing protein [Candidatus Riflebacteria bacterium]
MPSCEKYEDLLQQYLDKALDSAQTAVLMSHIEVCHRCRLDYKLYTKVVQGLEQMDELASPSRITADVMAQLDREPAGFAPAFAARRAPFGPWLWGMSTAFAAAVVAAFLILHPAAPVSQVAMNPSLDGPTSPAVAPVQTQDPLLSTRISGQRILLVASGGQVQVQRSNTSGWQMVSAATDVAYGDKIRTMPEASARIEYTQDKTTLKLRPNSLVQILTNAVRVYHGDTWIRVDKIGSHFQAETPNAVASVRGTRYSAEVHYPARIARLYEGDLDESRVVRRFVQEYTKNLTESKNNGLFPMLAYPMHATPVSLAVQVNMLLDSLNVARECKTNVQVFQSKVDVASIDPVTNQVTDHTMVHAGYQTSVKNIQLAKLDTIVEDDFTKWGLPVDTALLAQVRQNASAASLGTFGGSQPTVASPVRPVAAPPASGTMTIDAGIDRSSPGYDGVEKRH